MTLPLDQHDGENHQSMKSHIQSMTLPLIRKELEMRDADEA
jgi:hypothetical protein